MFHQSLRMLNIYLKHCIRLPQCGKTYQLIWSNSSAKIVDCPKASCFSSKLIATTWLRPQVIRNLQVLFCRKIWQSLEHFAEFKLTLLGRDNFSVDNLPPALDDVKWAEEGEASEITFQAAELVRMSSWNNARGFGPLLKKEGKITGCQKMSRIFSMQF